MLSTTSALLAFRLYPGITSTFERRQFRRRAMSRKFGMSKVGVKDSGRKTSWMHNVKLAARDTLQECRYYGNRNPYKIVQQNKAIKFIFIISVKRKSAGNYFFALSKYLLMEVYHETVFSNVPIWLSSILRRVLRFDNQ